MKRSLFVAMLVGVLAVVFSLSSFGQDAKKEMMKDMKKEGASKLMVVSCDPECGFMVKSHDEKELTEMVKSHAKNHHNKDVSDADVKGMMKEAGHDVMKHEMKKDEMKMEEKKK